MLDDRIKKDLLDRYQAMQDRGESLAKAQIDEYYATFRRRFGPEVLANLDGEALLSTMHDHRNRDSLVYWLEFKNDDEFPTLQFGSIAGGSALKLGIYKRNETGVWMTGSPQKQVELTVQGAIEIARRHRDQFLTGADVFRQLPRQADDNAYAKLQAELMQVAPDVDDTSWGHKYFSLLFPDRLDQLHNASYQRFHLVKLLQEPPSADGRYVCAGRFVRAANELDMPVYNLMRLLYERNGSPHYYWRIGTRLSERDSIWHLMRNAGCIAIGWSQLGDLSDVTYNRESKERIREALRPEYASAPGVLGQKTQEIFNFVATIAENDIVLAADGKRIIGIGRVSGGYQFTTGEAAPHRRPVKWLSFEEWDAEHREGLRTTVHQIREFPNLIEIERHLLTPQIAPTIEKVVTGEHGPTSTQNTLGAHVVPPLPSIPGRVQAVLDRKRQVILYGPPGTGKTYWARLAALDLAAYAAFGASFDQLPAEQQKVVLGNGADQAGLVRLCAFHPAYGYEDFLEGYRPLSHPESGHLAFERRDGIFKRLCDDAHGDPDRRYFLLVDEINRGDIPRIFGELLTVLERDKRGRSILLPLSGGSFSVPDNVYLIGTMNTADRSIALLDTALRRRFGFVELMPDSSVLGDAVVNGIPLGPWLDDLNRRIRQHVGRDARNRQIGHAYLLEGGKPVANFARFASILQEDIIPLLEEYCYEDYELLEKILGKELVDRAKQRICHELFDDSHLNRLADALHTSELETSPQAIKVTAQAEQAASTLAGDVTEAQ